MAIAERDERSCVLLFHLGAGERRWPIMYTGSIPAAVLCRRKWEQAIGYTPFLFLPVHFTA